MHRRFFLQSVYEALTACTLGGWLPGTAFATPREETAASAIDRRVRVARHDPVIRTVDPFAALTVGNGTFAFTADVTGLQTFPNAYREIPLATQAQCASPFRTGRPSTQVTPPTGQIRSCTARRCATPTQTGSPGNAGWTMIGISCVLPGRVPDVCNRRTPMRSGWSRPPERVASRW